jgi:hypothetical protein
MKKLIFAVLLVSACNAVEAPIATLSGLVSVKIYEQTSGLATYTYSPGASELATQLSGALAFGNADAVSLAAEFYDFWFGTFVRVMLPRARTSRWRACRTRWMATSQLRL